MAKKKLKEINSQFFFKVAFSHKRWFEQSIKFQVACYKQRYNDCIVKVYRNEKGARIIAYEEMS